jgi:hypothetical protein
VATQLPADVPTDPTAPPAEAPADAPAEVPAEVPVAEAPDSPAPPVQDALPTIPIIDESGSDIAPPNLVQPPAELPPTPSEPPVDPALGDPTEAAKEAAEGTPADATVPPEEGTSPDVDIATVPEGTGEGEYLAPISSEDWVQLTGDDRIPARVRGKRAVIVMAPRVMIPVGQTADVWLTVRVRDETNALITVPLDAVVLDRGGRARVG